MPRTCSICTSLNRRLIEKMIVENVPYREIEEKFSISKSVSSRHKKHIGEALAKSQEARESLNGDRLIKQLEKLQTKTLNVLNQAEESQNGRLALSAIREARGNIELVAKLLGELRESHVVNINPQWIQIRTIIINALEAYPEAKREVIKALDVRNS